MLKESTSEEPEVPTAPQVRGRRNPKWIALGVVALCLGALGALFLYNQLSNAQSVVAVSQTVHRGATIQPGDLTTATVGTTPGISTVPAGELDALIGQRAAFDLVAGSLVPAEAISSSQMPAANRSVVGIRLAHGRLPMGAIPQSTPLRLVAIPPPGADPAFKDGFKDKTYAVILVSSVEGTDGVSVLINVDVDARQASQIGLLAAQERLVATWEAEG